MADSPSNGPSQEAINRKISFLDQTNALFRKSAVNQIRQRKTNCCQISFPVLLLLLLFVFQIIVDDFVQQNSEFGATIPAVSQPPVLPRTHLHTDVTVEAGFDCSTDAVQAEFWYSNSSSVGPMVDNLRATPTVYRRGRMFPERGRTQAFCSIPQEIKVDPSPTYTSYADKAAMDKELYDKFANPDNTVFNGLVFRTVNYASGILDAVMLYNDTLTYPGRDLPTYVNTIINAFLKTSNPNNKIVFQGESNFPTPERENTFDLVSLIGPFLYVFVFQLIMPVIISTVVYEKESNLREIMIMMGLDIRVYWLVTYIFSYALYLVALLFMWALGAILGFNYFVQNDFGTIFFTIFLWGHLLVATSFLLSVFFNKSRTATVVGYLYVFGSGLLASQVIAQYLTPETDAATKFGISLVPPFGMFRALLILRDNVSFNQPGLRFADVALPEVGLAEVWAIQVVEWAIFLLLTAYLEAVLPTGFGVKKKPLFFLEKAYWTGEEHEVHHDLAEKVDGEPEDVARERSKMFDEKNDFALRIEDLHKVYPGLNGMPDKVAVKQLTMGIKYGECFGFLGPNGAGKSTTINMICGLYRPTAGTAYVHGRDIRTDMDKVHATMGVCPQDNVLWDDLTGREHLLFYGRIKGLSGDELDKAVQDGLDSVALGSPADANKRSSEYSGGMKRRLSVAMSLIGNPTIVIMDEPSTGLDPASRRKLWEVVRNARRSCAMLLTTHAMEEADALCDRLGIFAAGELKCVGSAAQLKQRFGKGYKLTVTTKAGNEPNVDEFVDDMCKGQSVKLNALAGTINYEVLKDAVTLSDVFKSIEEKREALDISDWGLANTTLEEVFLRIVLQNGQMDEDGTLQDVAVEATQQGPQDE